MLKRIPRTPMSIIIQLRLHFVEKGFQELQI
jgi:hypothetical protein